MSFDSILEELQKARTPEAARAHFDVLVARTGSLDAALYVLFTDQQKVRDRLMGELNALSLEAWRNKD